jgi:hypothetical protein
MRERGRKQQQSHAPKSWQISTEYEEIQSWKKVFILPVVLIAH